MMMPFPATVTDAELIAFIDRWAALLEQEDYEGAIQLTDHVEQSTWNASSLRKKIKCYGEADPAQRVTLEGLPNMHAQRKGVSRESVPAPDGWFGWIWYDLNINGRTTDLCASFSLRTNGGMTVLLEDIDKIWWPKRVDYPTEAIRDLSKADVDLLASTLESCAGYAQRRFSREELFVLLHAEGDEGQRILKLIDSLSDEQIQLICDGR